jgi:acetyl-CoA carboxylase biotin carboxyl carrier protein
MKKPERRPRQVSNENANSTEVNHSIKRGAAALPSLVEIKELIELISEKQFNEFEIQRGDFYLRIQIGQNRMVSEVHPQRTPPTNALAEGNAYSPTAVIPQAVAAPAVVPAAQEEEKLHIITSPIVGTFYRSPDPTSDPFVKIGDQVETGQTLCIIEAMKLMNEIQSDANGQIARIYVENGQPVEYGQRLFGLKV